jgi:hypothetical protein
MSLNLTTALIALAVLVLAAIGVQGWWQARRASPRRVPSADDGARIEPSMPGLGAGAANAANLGAAGAAGHASAPSTLGFIEARNAARRVPRVDALIDAIATISVDAPVAGGLALQHLPGSRRAGSKAFLVEGLDAASGEWEPPQPGATYSEFQAGVQLANRHGAMNEIEFSEFVQKVEAFAQAIGGTADFPDMLEAVGRARELDQFASEHDAQLVALLRANSVAWSVGFLQQCASRHGFVPGVVPGRLVLPATEEGAPPVLVLSFDAQAALSEDPGQAAVREVSLGLDVAQTEEGAEPFATWHGAARKLADDLDATVVDDQGQPITLHAFQTIHEELERLYQALAAHDLAAGTPGARRLFS